MTLHVREGTFRGLAVIMLSSQVSDRRFQSPLDPISGLAWSLYKRAVFWRAVYGDSATE